MLCENHIDIIYGRTCDSHKCVIFLAPKISFCTFSGQSPYERSTYRYPPILALLVTPNFLLFPEWGKLLFSVADVGIVYLIYAIRNELDVKRQGVTNVTRSFHNDADSVSSEDNNDIELTFQTSSDIGSTIGTGDGTGTGVVLNSSDSDVMFPSSFQDNDRSKQQYDATTSFSTIKNIIIGGSSMSSSSGNDSNSNSNSYNHSDTANNSNTGNSKGEGLREGVGVGQGCLVAWFWALNPLAINICTRGSADSITNCMVLALLYQLMQRSKYSYLIHHLSY